MNTDELKDLLSALLAETMHYEFITISRQEVVDMVTAVNRLLTKYERMVSNE